MAFLEVNFQSDVLGIQTRMQVLLPQISGNASGTTYPVLYLLHGMSQDCTSWMRFSSIERYTEHRNLAVIMPDFHQGWYTDMKYGFAYWTYLTKELPEICHTFFPHLSKKREETFAAGLSMGAYGALKCGICAPEQFAAVGALSAPPDIADHMHNPDFPAWEIAMYHDIFGTEEEYRGSFNDLYAQAKVRRNDPNRAKIFLCCGTEDRYLPQTRSMRDCLAENHYDLTYEESPGDHNFAYWDSQIVKFLDFLPLGKEGV